MKAMTNNFSEVLELYCNEDAVEGTHNSVGNLRNGRNNSGDRSPNVLNHAYTAADSKNSLGEGRRKKPVFLHSHTVNTKELDSLVESVASQKKSKDDSGSGAFGKGQATATARPKIPMRECIEDNHSMGSEYLILPEYASEQIYSEVLPKLVVYNQSLHGQISLWREHV